MGADDGGKEVRKKGELISALIAHGREGGGPGWSRVCGGVIWWETMSCFPVEVPEESGAQERDLDWRPRLGILHRGVGVGVRGVV